MASVSDGEDIYEFVPLDKERKEIRLLKLHNLGSDIDDPDPIRCELVKVSLDDAPKFHALSYTWGVPDFCQHMFVSISNDGGSREFTVPITENLHSALFHLRTTCVPKNWNDIRGIENIIQVEAVKLTDDEPPDLFWIDAVCINQSDEAEKSWQIAMMNGIYSSALQVVAWLGHEDPNGYIDALFEVCATASIIGWRLFGMFVTMPLTQVETIREGRVVRHLFPEDMAKWFQTRHHFHAGPESLVTKEGHFIWGLQSIGWLRDRPYWSRAWILQEIMLGKRVIVYLQYTWLHSQLLDLGLYIASQAQQLTGAMMPSHKIDDDPNKIYMPNTYAPLSLDRKYRDRDIQLSLPDLILTVRDIPLFATNPKDYIFALLGIADKKEVQLLGLDYSMSCIDIYTRVTRYWMRTEGAKVLSLCKSPRLQNGLPSWVPDYSNLSSRNNKTIWELVVSARSICCLAPYTFSESARKLAYPPVPEDRGLYHSYTMFINSGDVKCSEDFVLTRHALLVDRVSELLPRVCFAAAARRTMRSIAHHQVRLSYAFRRIKRQSRMYLSDEHCHMALAYALCCGGTNRRSTDQSSPSSMTSLFEGYRDIISYEPLKLTQTNISSKGLLSIKYEAVITAIIAAGYTDEDSETLALLQQRDANDEDTVEAKTAAQKLLFTLCTNIDTLNTHTALPKYVRFGKLLSQYVKNNTGDIFASVDRSLRFIDPVSKMCQHGSEEIRRPFLTEKGYVGLGPKGTDVGDCVSLIHLGYVPLILRRKDGVASRWPAYTLIGESYVHGLMDRKASDMAGSKRFDCKDRCRSPEKDIVRQPVPDGEEVILNIC